MFEFVGRAFWFLRAGAGVPDEHTPLILPAAGLVGATGRTTLSASLVAGKGRS